MERETAFLKTVLVYGMFLNNFFINIFVFIKAFYVRQAIVGHHLISINKCILAYRGNAWYAICL